MNSTLITAIDRKEKSKKVRRQGLIPGIVYGRGKENKPVKFDEIEFIKLLRQHGEKAKIKLKINGEEKDAIIKAVDRDAITDKILHVDIQVVNEQEVVNWSIPIVFLGKEKLEAKRLLLNIDIDEIKVVGKVNDIPDSIEIDVSNKNINDSITIKDLNLKSSIRTMKSEDTTLATIIASESGTVSEEEEEEEE